MRIAGRALTIAAILAVFTLPTGVRADDLDNLYKLRAARTRRVSSSNPDWRNANSDNRPVPPGETLTVADIQGAGIIRHIWFTISASDPQYHRSLVLRMYWDGAEEPAVESPIGDFFASGHGLKMLVNSLPVATSSEGRALNCYWPMPFAKGARITLTNEAKVPVRAAFFYIDYEEMDSLPPETANFHAQYRQEYPAKMGEDYLILDAEGRGHYVGTVMSVRTVSEGWFGEGDDRFYIDGEEVPSLQGTGTEDYFCDAWGYREFNRPFYGVVSGTGRKFGEHVTTYRWHINDPVHFQKSLKVTIEHKGVTNNAAGKRVSGFMERPDLISSVAYWYQTGQAKRFATLPPAAERVVPRHTLQLDDFKADMVTQPAGTTLELQSRSYNGGKQVLAKFEAQGGVLTVPFKVEQDLKGFTTLHLTKSRDYGIWKVSLDGKVLPGMAAIDLYSPDVTPTGFDAGYVELDAGTHELKLECVGKNEKSKGYYVGVDALELEELAKYVVKRQR